MRALWPLALFLTLMCPATSAAETASEDPQKTQLPRALTTFGQPPPDLSRFRLDDPKRAQAYLVVLAQRLDTAEGLSAEPAWRAIMGWGRAGETMLTWSGGALDEAEGRYPTALGQANPRADFAASIALAWSAPRFSCRFPLRARFLSERGLIPAPLAIDTGGCERFEAWADLDTIEGVEIIFTTPSWSDPAATAGHLLMRLRPRQDTAVTSTTSERVLSYAVDMDVPENNEWRLLKGLIGIHRGELMLNNNWEIAHRYNTLEQRDTIIYDLKLSERELRDLMALFWVQHTEGTRVPYSFFSVNCARMTYDAMRAVIPTLPRRPSWFAHPHEILSVLVSSGRLTPRGVQHSRRSLALAAERTQTRLKDTLTPIPGFQTLHNTRWEPVEAREAALKRFAERVPLDSLSPAHIKALTRYTDAIIDVENHALDIALGAFNDKITNGVLDAALDLRARLPVETLAREAAFPSATIRVSGSRRATLRSGVNQNLDPVARLRLSVVDEQPGESRAVNLRRSSRYEFMLTETAIRWDGDQPRVDEARLTLLSTTNYGTHVRTTEGWLSSRTGFSLDITFQALPSQGIPAGGWLRLGESLTLAHSDDETGLLAVGLDLTLASWAHEGDELRGGAGAWAEMALPLSSEGIHHLRFYSRATPGLSLGGGFVEVELRASLDLLLSRRSGLMVGPFFQLGQGLVSTEGWVGGLSVGY